ncbi:MAG TPA: hypothetical protein VNF50_13630 [Acidimicrobiales bacterium]|nr:hypothetical protein [Acidimicrobiales bacterium]
MGAALAAVAGFGFLSAPRAGADAGLGSYSLYATAPGVEWTYDSPTAPTHPEMDSEVPETVARLQPGPVGYGLATVAWPGTLIADGGSTAALVGLTLPQPLAANANEPVRAEARTGSGPPTVTNDSYPGMGMTATATDQEVSGMASMAGATGPAPSSSTGSTTSSSDVKLEGPTTVITVATSTVKDIDLGGVVKIASVTSTASATSNGTRAKVSGSTVVSGMTVAGQPVSIDQSGVHVLSSSAPLNAVASEIVNTAITGMGMKIEVSQPAQSLQAGDATYDAGSVVFYWSPPGSGGQTFTATIGGATINLQAAPGSAIASTGVGSIAGSVAPTSGGAAGGSSLGTGPASSGSSSPSPTVGAGSSPAGGAAGSGTPPTLSATPASYSLTRGISPVWPLLFLLGSAAVAAGLRRLPDRVLEESGIICSLEDSP